MNITTKYSIDEVVWGRRVHTEGETAICALCNGTGKVEIAAAPGLMADCPTCDYGSPQRAQTGRIVTGRIIHKATIQQLSIGQVQTRISHDEREVRYMAWETGVGSGTLWDEKDLYPTQEEAEAVPLPDPIVPAPKKKRAR